MTKERSSKSNSFSKEDDIVDKHSSIFLGQLICKKRKSFYIIIDKIMYSI